MFNPVESSVSFPKLEEKIAGFWKTGKIYEKSLDARAGAPAFVFYEGPPTANGLPHPGHCLTRAIKDLFPRYKTMRGYRCERKAGWDTHGLPVEVEVCKELGIHSKEEIEEYGIEPFVQKCVESVFRYTREWEQLTERLGFWIHLDEAYVTFHQSYVESVWWSLKNLFDRGLLYQGHKIVWWWAQGGTALSSGEVGEGYREVADPSIYVRFPIVLDERAAQRGISHETSLLVWTTTPWTLLSNMFTAVHEDVEYATLLDESNGERLIVAAELADTIAQKAKLDSWKVVSSCKGQQLVGLRYRPPFPECFYNVRVPGTRTTYGDRQRPLKNHHDEYIAWRVVAGDFVTLDTGTGLVHQAPAFGEVDFELWRKERSFFQSEGSLPLLHVVGEDGKFRFGGFEATALPKKYPALRRKYEGRWVKEADGDIVRDLNNGGLLFHREQYLHDYPFCPRAEEDALIQYPRRSWFVRTTQFKDRMLANNSGINWLPEHIRDGRFGNFLETNVDWALSRERYWGTPLPIWVCEETGHKEAVASYEELLAKPGVTGTEAWEEAKRKNPKLPDDLCVHKPYIDEVTYDSPKAKGSRMRRVSEVIDCWFDAGAMPFAQWGYPHQPDSQPRFESQFPADFISEALDQTRGWFYSLLAISTLLFSKDTQGARGEESGDLGISGLGDFGISGSGDSPRHPVTPSPPHPVTPSPPHPYPHPFRNCIVLGLLLGEDGEKMSKRKRNYPQPSEIFDRYGADAMRWYFFANQPPWTTIRFSEQAIRQSIPEFLLTLWNVYSFFVIYANIDGFDPAEAISPNAGQLDGEVLATAESYRAIDRRGELDRWMLSELSRTAAAVTERMDAYDNFGACARLTELVDALSNWYVRRSRDRFWSGEQSTDKTDAYWTLYECLLTTCKLIAPFVPFLAEQMWQNLAVSALGKGAAESVHLCDYPTGRTEVVDEALSAQMALVREIVSLGRSARMAAKLKVRQPLSLVEVVLADDTHQAWLERHAGLICDELNVKRVEFTEKADQYITYTVLPNLKRLGPRLGKQLPALRNLLARADGGKLLAELEATNQLTLELPEGPVVLDGEDIQVRMQAKEGWAAAQGRASVVVLSTELTEELIAEGYARELVRAIQDRRKETGCQYTDRIVVGVVTESEELRGAVKKFCEYIQEETLAVELRFEALAGVEPVELKIAGHPLTLYVKVVDGRP